MSKGVRRKSELNNRRKNKNRGVDDEECLEINSYNICKVKKR